MVLLFLLLLPTSTNSHFVQSPSASIQPVSSEQNNELQLNCGRVGGSKKIGLNKIDFGDLARPGQFPWAAALETTDGKRLCSASVISSRHVLTVAHCVLDTEKCIECMNGRKTEKCDEYEYSNANKTSDQSTWIIAYGGHCNTRVGVRAIAWDERYANFCAHYDMAIVELEREIQFDFEFGSILPICLAHPSFPYNGSILTFFGFGSVAEDNDAETRSSYSQLRYGVSPHYWTMRDGSEMTFDYRLSRNESERLNQPFLPRSQLARGDSGGGLSTTGCDGSTLLIGTITQSSKNTTQSYASVLATHIDEICTLTGVCPIDRC
ncbi:hypothetical protein PRIPAC_93343 [Pristionchus pacificus]|nr:hypothetical protein PRIPAC_93343 [Pristionchus pacificus]|eukprot:PDM65923.1 Trypsin [Pristionchus pacificus]